MNFHTVVKVNSGDFKMLKTALSLLVVIINVVIIITAGAG